MSQLREMAVSDIRVEARIREDAGDIQALADSIEDIGLLHPIVVSPDGTLLAGMRRLLAVKHLGWKTISVTIAEPDYRKNGAYQNDITKTPA